MPRIGNDLHSIILIQKEMKKSPGSFRIWRIIQHGNGVCDGFAPDFNVGPGYNTPDFNNSMAIMFWQQAHLATR